MGEEGTIDTKWYRISKQMISSKLAYFCEYAKEGSHWPYLVLFYVSIGLDPAQAGLISGLRFIGGILGAPIIGWIADRTGWHKGISIIICFLAAATNFLQPTISMLMGDRQNNICPKILANTTNVTGTMSTDSYKHYTPTTNMRLFYTLLGTSLAASLFDGSTIAFVDSGVLQKMLISKHPTDIGKERYFGPLGVGVAAFISGIFIDYFPIESISCYTAIFIIYLIACTGMAITFAFLFRRNSRMRSRIRGDTDRNTNQLLKAKLKRFETWLFFGIVFFNGMALALAFSFSFLFLDELNASSLVTGFGMAVNGITGALCYVISDKLSNFLGGNMHSMAFSCLWWSVRYFSLAFMNKSYQFPLICMMNGLTCSLFVSAYIRFIKQNFHPAIFTVVCGISGALYNSGGYLVANIIGGIVYKAFGAKRLFIGCGASCLVVSCLTFIYSMGLNRRRKLNESTQTDIGLRPTSLETTTGVQNDGFAIESSI